MTSTGYYGSSAISKLTRLQVRSLDYQGARLHVACGSIRADCIVQVVEEWVCWCGSLQQMSKSKCSVCSQPRRPDAKIVARRATPAEVLHRLSDKVCCSPLESECTD